MPVSADKLDAWAKVVDANLRGKTRPGDLKQVFFEMQEAWLDALREEIRERPTLPPPPDQVETRVSTSEMSPACFEDFGTPRALK